MATLVRDNLTGQTHRVQTPAQYVRQLQADKATLAIELAGPCRNDQWRADRINELAWINKELTRLGHGPTL